MITEIAPGKIQRQYAGMFAVGPPDYYPAGSAPEGFLHLWDEKAVQRAPPGDQFSKTP